MKYSALLSTLILFACGSNRTEILLNEQKILKDNTNNIRERIGDHLQKGAYDSAETEKKQLGTVHARLIDIQSSIDSLNKLK